jgi:hypothetical protein
MEALRPGAHLIHDSAAVELLYLASAEDRIEFWWVKLIFVKEAQTELRAFHAGRTYKGIHGSHSFSV